MTPRKRSNASAKAAGRNFEKLVANYLAETVDDRIERRRQTGALDRGDIAAVRTKNGQRVVIECKNTSRPTLAAWLKETETERQNDNAAIGVIAHKRHGNNKPGEQLITMTLKNFATLLKDRREGN